MPTTSLNHAIPSEIVHTPPLMLDRKRRLIMVDQINSAQVFELTHGETTILATMMEAPERTFSCVELARMALGEETNASDAERIIRPYIFRLRRKLSFRALPHSLICTIRGKGYRLRTQ